MTASNETTDAPAIEVSGLECGYGGEAVLRDVSFAVEPGEIFVLMGPSGSGKSVLLKHVVGLERPSAGRVLVDGHDASGQETDLAAEDHEVSARGTQRLTVLASEVGNCLEVGCEAADQPHQLNIAPGLPLQAPARRDLIEIAVQVEFEQRRRMIAWAAGDGGRHAGKAKGCEIEFVDEHIDDASRVIDRKSVG